MRSLNNTDKIETLQTRHCVKLHCQVSSTMSNYIDGVKLHRPCQITTTSCDELHRLRTAENTFTCSRHLLTKKHHAFETCYEIVFQNEKLRTPRRVELEWELEIGLYWGRELVRIVCFLLIFMYSTLVENIFHVFDTCKNSHVLETSWKRNERRMGEASWNDHWKMGLYWGRVFVRICFFHEFDTRWKLSLHVLETR